jgi:hypothetical protein
VKVSDIVPIACKAAAQVGIPSVCVSNFSWDFIYSEYVTVAGNDHRSIVWQVSLWLQESLSETLVVLLLRLLRELLLHSQQSVE